MKQIRTIVYRLDDVLMFDAAVNALLEDGWDITERKVLQPTTPPPAIGPCPPVLLYAAMERYILGEDEKNCENCKHCDLPPDAAPCRDCSDTGDKWEPRET
jgi:hypothetical protein